MGALQGSTHLDLRGCGLSEMPIEVLALADTLQVLDLSGNALSSLPEGLARMSRLHTVFASSNRFTELPPVLGRLPLLDTLGFKANQIAEVQASALAPTLRWLILTDNRITALPSTLGDCSRMQKLMLAGNRLSRLPIGIHRLQRLELLRLSANLFERAQDALPDELLALPKLAWLAHAGNPFSQARELAARASTVFADAIGATAANPKTIDIEPIGTRVIAWSELSLQGLLGEGASGHIHAARWQPAHGPAQEVALKLFKGALTSDGLPESEISATLAAGAHPHLMGALGVLSGHPQGTAGLVLPRLASHWAPLAGPPSMASCSRDVYQDGLRLPAAQATAIAQAASEALSHLHSRGLSHGDLYAHNLLVDGHGQALLSDFGAASFLPTDAPEKSSALQAIDRRALNILVAELAQHCDAPAAVLAAI